MSQTQEQAQQILSVSINEIILNQLRDLKESQREMNNRMDRIERRMDKLEEEMKITRQELNTRIDKLADKIDALHNEIKSSTGHISIANISTVGITLAVIYAVLK